MKNGSPSAPIARAAPLSTGATAPAAVRATFVIPAAPARPSPSTTPTPHTPQPPPPDRQGPLVQGPGCRQLALGLEQPGQVPLVASGSVAVGALVPGIIAVAGWAFGLASTALVAYGVSRLDVLREVQRLLRF